MHFLLAKISVFGLLYVSSSAAQTLRRRDGQAVLASNIPPRCPLPQPHSPSQKDGHVDSARFWSNETLAKQIERLSAVVAVPSVCFDDLGEIGRDERWEPFVELHKVLRKLFPLVHKHAVLENVNHLGLVYTIAGTDNTLLPIMFTAHQDVVPAQDPSTWTHSPFKPYYDGQFLWGRGSCDCKNNLIGTLSAVEKLLELDAWQPKRTIILAYGFDEECNGYRGAAHIADFLERRWGKDGIALIFDEGGMGLDIKGDAIYALPAVHEKSATEIYIDLAIQGGHASKPPPHTGIGIMAEIIVALEAHPYVPKLVPGSPYYQHLACQAEYSPDADPWLGPALDEGRLDFVAEEISKQTPEIRFRLQTSQAVDLIQGGAKINALPSSISIGIDYRIAEHDSIEGVKANVRNHVDPIVTKYGLKLVGFEETANAGSSQDPSKPNDSFSYSGTIYLREVGSSQPVPISPTRKSVIWDEFSGTVRHVYSQYAKTVVPVGDIMNGNTDTRHYLNLTKNIYRWSPSRLGTRVNVHGIDEHLDMSAHIDGYRMYYDLIRNFDVSKA